MTQRESVLHQKGVRLVCSACGLAPPWNHKGEACACQGELFGEAGRIFPPLRIVQPHERITKPDKELRDAA